MWPIHILLNKLLNGGYNVHEDSDDMNLVKSYNFKSSLNYKKGENEVLVKSHFIDVPHVKQEHTWDCGLACVLMVLRTLHINHYDIEDLEAFCNTNSIWTVDLAYLLHKFSISFSYITVTLGANPNFSLETFYEKQLGDDIVRVNMLFKRSREAGINIECRSIKGDEIAFLITSGKYIVIALVDKYILSLGQRMFTYQIFIVVPLVIQVIILLYVAMLLLMTNLRSGIQPVLGVEGQYRQDAWKKLANVLGQMKISSW